MKKICVYLFTFIFVFSLIGLYGCDSGGSGGGDDTPIIPIDDTSDPVDPPTTPPPDDLAVKMFNSGDSPWVSDIIEDSSGNILAVASDENDTHITVLKLDSSGTQLFNRYTAAGTWVYAANIFETGSGYIVTGSVDATNGSLFTMNVDESINFSGALYYDCPNAGSSSSDSIRLSDGSIIFAGFTDQEATCSAFIPYGDALITGIGPTSSQDFRVNYNMAEGYSDQFAAIVAVSDGALAAAGTTNEYDDGTGYGGPNDTILVKTGPTGSIAWTQNYGYQNDDGGNVGAVDLIETSDGGFAILARSGYAYAMYVIKTDANGNVSWEKNAVSGDSSYIARKFIQAEDGGFVIVGQGTDAEGAVVKLDNNGTKVWEYNMQGLPTAITKTSDGYIVAGHVTPDFAVEKIFVLKLDANGSRIW